MNTLQRYTALLAIAVSFIAGHALAADIKVVTVAEKEMLVVDDNGNQRTEMQPVTTVIPGDHVVYTITFTNDGQAPAERVVITDPVPAEMRYVDGSAFGPGADIEFSVDSGNSWGTAGTLRVAGDDGNLRPARASDYTHIRWSMRGPLAAGGRGFARFRAELR